MASELKLFGHAPGSYMNNCKSCGQTFMGDKRAWNCEPCAKALLLQANTRPAPAATDTGLVTVGYMGKTRMGWVPTFHGTGEPVCPRSQAEELLAAERADKRIWMEKAAIEAERVERLEADNAAQAARIKELEEALDIDPSGSDLWRYWSRKACETSQKYVDEVNRAEALEAKLSAAEKALEAIEDHAARCFSLSTHSTIALAYLQDIQDEARAALGGKPS